MITANAMMGLGKINKDPALENFFVSMERFNLKAIGKRINVMVTELNFGQMVQNLLEIMKTTNISDYMVNLIGSKETLIKENLILILIYTELVNVPGLTEDHTKVNGRTTKCMVMEFLLGQTVENMLETISTT